MKDSTRHLWLAALAALAFGCGKRGRETPRPEEAPPAAATEAEAAIDRSREDAELQRQYEQVMAQKRLAAAKAHRDAGEMDQALRAADDALGFDPTSEEALRLRREIRTMIGSRPGEVEQVIEDEWEAQKVRLDEQKVTVQRLLADAEQKLALGDWAGARRDCESALFIVETSRYSALGADAELRQLGEQARERLARVEREEARSDEQLAARDTEAALRTMIRQEEEELARARSRRARLLDAAIDSFNFEKFDVAITYAEQVLAEEPDNTVAQDLLANARTAKHSRLSVGVLLELKESYRQWQVDIEETKVPSSRILQWPSRSYWDRISELRAAQRAIGRGRVRTAEEEAVWRQLEGRHVDLAFQKTPFPVAVNYLTAASGLNIVVDPRAKEDLEAVEVDLQLVDVPMTDALTLLLKTLSSENAIVYEVVGNVVRILKREHQRRNFVLAIHPVSDLTLGLTDFIPPEITLVGVDEDSEKPLFGGEGEEKPQPYGTIEELMELVRGSVSPELWEDPATLSVQGKNLVVYNSPDVQAQVQGFLDDLRAFAGITVTVESRFLVTTDAFLRDVGVDLRGLGGAAPGPLVVLDDVTSGLDDNASAAIDNSGPGVSLGGAALPPSAGLFFSDGVDGDFRARNENIFSTPMGELLSALGGGTFQVTYLDDLSLGMILRATEKSANFRQLEAPTVSVYNTQRAYIAVVNQISYVQDFDVEVAQTAFIADPVIGVVQEGLSLDVRPTVSNDRQFITLEARPTVVDLILPIQTFTTLLGAAAAPGRVVLPAQNPVVIQLPEIDIREAESTLRIPDGGSVLMGGLKDITVADRRSTAPVLGNVPVLSFLFGRQGKSDEVVHTMVILTATITDPLSEADHGP